MKARTAALLSTFLLAISFHAPASAAIPERITAPACPGYGSYSVTGHVPINGINEVSGVVASRGSSALWIEEDSGNPTTIYAIDGTGAKLATVQVRDSTNHDWEDIALADGQIWLGDIGDNAHLRTALQVYWFAEPALSATSVAAKLLTLTYDDRVARNAEALAVDGAHEKLFIFTKAQSGGSLVFRASIDGIHSGSSRILRHVATLPLNEVTAADLGPIGVIVKSGDGYLYRWTSDHRVLSALAQPPCRAPAGTGESLAFSTDDQGLWAIPEGADPPIYFTPPG